MWPFKSNEKPDLERVDERLKDLRELFKLYDIKRRICEDKQDLIRKQIVKLMAKRNRITAQ